MTISRIWWTAENLFFGSMLEIMFQSFMKFYPSEVILQNTCCKDGRPTDASKISLQSRIWKKIPKFDYVIAKIQSFYKNKIQILL